MQAEFWHQKWEKGEIAFHEIEPNPLLTRHYGSWNLKAGERVFLPLCGKTRDIGWLLGRGYRILGVELSRIAVTELFEELALSADIAQEGAFTRYRADSIDILVGDFFALTAHSLGPVEAVYDRAALVALPQTTRAAYSRHLRAITAGAPQLLITVQYDPKLMAGPPFSLEPAEIEALYARPTPLETRELPGGLKGKVAATETVWLVPALSESGQTSSGDAPPPQGRVTSR